MSLTSMIRRIAACSAAAVVMAGVFSLYTRPEIAVMLAEQLWACFGA